MAALPWNDANYSHRAMLVIATASTTADSFVWVPQPWWDAFWGANGVQNTGYDVRFFNANGAAALQHERASWTYASKTASFEVLYADLFGANDYSEFFWVYFGDTDASDTTTSTATTSSVFPTMSPRITAPGERTIAARPADPGSTTPQARISKTTTETIMVWWDVTDMLGRADETLYDRETAAFYLLNVDWDSTAGTGAYLAGTRQAAMTTQAGTLAFETGDGRTYIGIVVTGGTVDVDYTLSLRFTVAAVSPGYANTSQLREALALLQVRDPDETGV